MIIRAVSNSSDDDDDHNHGNDTAMQSAFSSGAAFSQGAASSLSASTTVKLAWLGASLALIALLLLDLAALLNQLFPAQTTIEPPRAADPFTLVSWLLLLWRQRGTSSQQPATVLNNLLGQLFVCAWIYGRETALAPQRQRLSPASRHNESMKLPTSILRHVPWILVIAVLCLGHLVSCSYILVALFESHGGSVRTKFWLGRSSISAGSRTAPRV